jgi:hypothetical protein
MPTRPPAPYELRLLYSEACRLRRFMKSISADSARAEEYYRSEEKIKHILNEIIKQDFTLLSKVQLINFLMMCSSHRPMPLHQLLTMLTIRWEAHGL